VNNHRRLMAVVALAVVDFALFMTSGIPRYRDATDGLDNVIGNAVWFGFLIGALTLVVIGVLSLVRLRRRAGMSRTLRS
jgi:Na+/H+ antiporter NhaD/arsenite permease-like protein